MVTKRLRLNTPIKADQTLLSYVGELALMNLQPSTSDFCLDMGTNLHALAMGEAAAIERIAFVSGSAVCDIDRAAFQRKGRAMTFRGQTLTLQARSPQVIRFCPQCLMDDVARAEQAGFRRPQRHAYGRAQWLVTQYRTCTSHSLQLAAIPSEKYSNLRHDFAGAVLPLLGRLAELGADLAQRPASDFERYLEHRLLNGADGELGEIGFSIISRFCEVLGAVALYGRRPPHLGFDDATWQQAGAAGFAIVERGIDHVLEFLGSLRRPEERDSRDGAHNDWGIVHDWMEDTRDEEIEPLLERVRDHIEANYPIAPGKMVFGRFVQKRKMHSVWTAAKEYGLLGSVLRPQLVGAGVVPDDPDAYDNHLLFPAAPHSHLLERLSRGISALHAQQRINCERQVFGPLVKAGILAPIVDVASGYPLFDTADLDAFIDRLLNVATPYKTKPDGLETIATARKWLICAQPEIVKLILDGRLKSVGKLEDEVGFAAVLVDPLEVAPLVRGKELGGIVVVDIVADLGIHFAGVMEMLEVHLPTVERMHPTRRCLQRVVDETVYAKFKAKYASLRNLARAAGVHSRTKMVELRKRGIHPEPGFPDRVHLYLRSKLE
ncbi:MAG: TniQ family protein [Devosia sp.]|uniref:TniQ family protein n=1 Tax=Devosia sp. TaxID=1871048 RepID=UPI001A4EDD06|nr:TniQ family protein [Devosia sp.]MBL8597774.1 TniQ family protein [Devosia sp.]